VLIDAISCVNDYESGCLHKSKGVHEREKRNQAKMTCYIYFSGKGQMVAKVMANGLSHNLLLDHHVSRLPARWIVLRISAYT
jgi:4-diphosphocytidyl-2C-methyl-D-erythritol kinase